jgi:hypothetical protein
MKTYWKLSCAPSRCGKFIVVIESRRFDRSSTAKSTGISVTKFD